ncbi:MAG: hypothetical protein R3F61_13680 [Myxococcota bacterium]
MKPTVDQYHELYSEMKELDLSQGSLTLLHRDLAEFVAGPTSYDLLLLRERGRNAGNVRGSLSFSTVR